MRARFSAGVPALGIAAAGGLSAQGPAPAPHQHLVATCVDVSPGQPRPEFGCFTLAVAKGLQFKQPRVSWYLRVFPSARRGELQALLLRGAARPVGSWLLEDLPGQAARLDFFPVAGAPWYQRTSIFWVMDAKSEETRARRADQTAGRSPIAKP